MLIKIFVGPCWLLAQNGNFKTGEKNMPHKITMINTLQAFQA